MSALWCGRCHGLRGGADGANARFLPLTPAAHQRTDAMTPRSGDARYDTTYGGAAIMNRCARLPAFEATLAEAQIRAKVAHIRALCA